MTSATYANPSALALRMISAKGALVTFTRRTAAIDPVTQAGPPAASTYEARVVAFPLSAGKAAFIFGQGAANVSKARLDVHIALKGVSASPQEGDRFSFGGRTYALLAPTILNPDGSGGFYANALAEAA